MLAAMALHSPAPLAPFCTGFHGPFRSAARAKGVRMISELPDPEILRIYVPNSGGRFYRWCEWSKLADQIATDPELRALLLSDDLDGHGTEFARAQDLARVVTAHIAAALAAVEASRR